MDKSISINIKTVVFLALFFSLNAKAESDKLELPKYLKDHIFFKYPDKIPLSQPLEKIEPHYSENKKNTLYIKIFFSDLNEDIEKTAYFSDYVRSKFKNTNIKYYQIITRDQKPQYSGDIVDPAAFQVFETFGAIPDLNADIARYMSVETLPIARLSYNNQIKFIPFSKYESFTMNFLKKLLKRNTN